MKEIIINQAIAGKKLFKFLQTKILTDFKNSDIFRVIREKKVKVNGKKSDPNYVLQQNDQIKIFLPDNVFSQTQKTKFQSVKIDLDIIYENDDFIVINKKNGIPVHSTNNDYKNNVTESVRAYLYKSNQYDPANYFAPSPAHRLDTNTTGVLIFAKNQQALSKITEIFRIRKCKKVYQAICLGNIPNPITIVSQIDTSENKQNKVTVSNLATFDNFDLQNRTESDCITIVKPIKSYGNATLLEIELVTGKKHQIRAHLQAINHPLIGDQKYNTKQSLQFSKNYQLNSYFLHCKQINLPEYGIFTAEIPSTFRKFINVLAQNNNLTHPKK